MRRGAIRVGQGLTLAAVALLLAMTGAGLLIWSLYLSLADALGSALGALFTGLASLLAAGLTLWIASLVAR